MPFFNRHTYSIPDQEDIFESPNNYNHYIFYWDSSINPYDHLDLILNIDRYKDAYIQELLLKGLYKETIIYILYKYKRSEPVIPSMILSLNKKSLYEISQLISKLLS